MREAIALVPLSSIHVLTSLSMQSESPSIEQDFYNLAEPVWRILCQSIVSRSVGQTMFRRPLQFSVAAESRSLQV